MAKVTLSGINKWYGGTVHAVQGISFEIADGAQLPLGLSLVLDRGKAPELIEEFRVQVIAKAPAGTTPAIGQRSTS